MIGCNINYASDSPDGKINFFLEASRRSNMVCMQLYTKEIECRPGASSAASILSRNVQTHGLDSKKSSEVKVLVFLFFYASGQPARILLSSKQFNLM